MHLQATFSFFTTFSFFHSPHCSFLHDPRCSFLLVLPCFSFLLPPRPSFFLVQRCLNHLESVKVHFLSILTKALPTDQRRTNGRADKASNRDARVSRPLATGLVPSFRLFRFFFFSHLFSPSCFSWALSLSRSSFANHFPAIYGQLLSS